jgi:protein TonB
VAGARAGVATGDSPRRVEALACRLGLAASLAVHAGLVVAAARLGLGRAPGDRADVAAAESSVFIRLVVTVPEPIQPVVLPFVLSDLEHPLPDRRLLPADRPPALEAAPLPDPAPAWAEGLPVDFASLVDSAPDGLAAARPGAAKRTPGVVSAQHPSGPSGKRSGESFSPPAAGAWPTDGPADGPPIHGLEARPTSTAPAPADREARGDRPARAVDPLRPHYPPHARRLGQEGTVVLEVEVLADGRAGAVRVIESPGHPLLVEAAEDAVRRARFTPATRDGRPVRSLVRIPFTFRLE